MKARWLLAVAVLSAGCASPGPMPLPAGVGGRALQCDAAGTAYWVQQDGTYVIHLESKSMGGKTDATLCVEPSAQGWRPPDPCRSDTRIDEWRTDRGADWIVELKAGCALSVWLKERNFTTRATTGCPAGAQLDSASFSGSGGFHVTFSVTRL